MKKNYKFYYKNKRMLNLTDKELKECSDLYSENYGIYTRNAPCKAGENIKMAPSYYKKHYFKNDYYITLAYKNRVLVGQALYIRKKVNKWKYMTWIVQLVVKKTEREKGIAKKLMQSIWGFSNDYAWGLVTPNIYTIQTLESTTFRRCTPKIIKKHLYEIEKLASDIDFIDPQKFIINTEQSVVDTNFHVVRKYNPYEHYHGQWTLGSLPEGFEWLAFTFNQQDIDVDKYKDRAKELIEFSEDNLKDAYSRMRIKKHKWAKNSKAEVDYILNFINIKQNSNILDMGCGIARHSIELALRNYNVVGIDFSKRHIKYARKQIKKQSIQNLRLYPSDARNFNSTKSFDLILCLYDVIGSFPEEKDNIQIIKNAYKLLNKKGYMVISVMNYELTESIVPQKQKDDLLNHPEILMKLAPSTDMMATGNIFNPEHLAIDTKTKIVYRKEQFPSMKSGYLPAEYIIRDKRYTMNEISELVEKEGFKIIDSRYVQAGKFEKSLNALDKSAKEILLFCQKV